MNDARFPRQARVRARADFDRIFKDGRRVALPMLALHWLAGAEPARLGLAVSRKVDRRAVGRNRIKRVLRDQFRHSRAVLAAGAYVFVARPSAASASSEALRAAMMSLLRRAGALPHPSPDGTMPAADSRMASPPPPTAPRPSGE
ncbi:ribonuclease P protein component [Luteimonas sp. SDU82]|uniref:ribonuclease P protein component n=1 Tax=Luteimonas sp. SDU82 TaxID=3422592 RepID=UPI003EB6AFC3